jgi:peptidoglycan/LPS O-acetylase OafA/YrhL
MKVYFKNLDGIRFFAALFVLLQHSFGFRKGYSTGYAFLDKCFEYTGILGVNLFFILSGFLISYLLLMEKDTTSTISYRNFYIRRILRIWPLYLGYGLILTFFSPRVSELLGLGNNTDFPLMMLNLLFLFLFSVNMQIAFLGDNKGVFEISWSVCVEEQFYLMWPVLINNFRKKLPGLLVVMFSISILSRLLFCVYLPAHNPARWPYDVGWDANYLLIFDKLDLFGGGLVVALIWYHREKYKAALRKWFHPAIQAVMVALALLYTLNFIRPEGSLLLVFTDHYVCDILYGYVLLAAVIDNSILRLETPLLRTLGKVSYGIYLFHTAVCQVVLVAFKKVIQHPESHLIYDALYPLMCIVVTCVIAYVSYEYYEKRFLRLKNKFAVVATRI